MVPKGRTCSSSVELKSKSARCFEVGLRIKSSYATACKRTWNRGLRSSDKSVRPPGSSIRNWRSAKWRFRWLNWSRKHLIVVGNRPEQHLRRALARVLEPVLGEPKASVWDSLRLAIRNTVKPSRVLRLWDEKTVGSGSSAHSRRNPARQVSDPKVIAPTL